MHWSPPACCLQVVNSFCGGHQFYGFEPTHACADLFLEDALESTGLLIGKSSKWAKRSGSGKQGKDGSAGSGDAAGGGGGGAAADQEDGSGAGGSGLGQYSEQTRISLSNVDESLVNTDLIEALVAHLISSRGQQQQQQAGGGGKRRGGGDDDANAILIFAPGGWAGLVLNIRVRCSTAAATCTAVLVVPGYCRSRKPPFSHATSCRCASLHLRR